MIYLDNAATTPLLPRVKSRLINFVGYENGLVGNPSSTHFAGEQSERLLEKVREKIREMFNVREDDLVIFTSGATEGNNIVESVDRTFVKSAIEHSSVGAAKREIPVDENGVVNLSCLEDCLKTEKDVLASIMLANNETGAIQPIKEAAEMCHAKGALIHTDATAAAGHIPIDFQELGVDFLTFSGHKIGAPTGIGALIVKSSAADEISAVFSGGGQEYGYRPGTQNVLGIVGLGEAAEWYKGHVSGCEEHYIELGEAFLREMGSLLPIDGWRLRLHG